MELVSVRTHLRSVPWSRMPRLHSRSQTDCSRCRRGQYCFCNGAILKHGLFFLGSKIEPACWEDHIGFVSLISCAQIKRNLPLGGNIFSSELLYLKSLKIASVLKRNTRQIEKGELIVNFSPVIMGYTSVIRRENEKMLLSAFVMIRNHPPTLSKQRKLKTKTEQTRITRLASESMLFLMVRLD